MITLSDLYSQNSSSIPTKGELINLGKAQNTAGGRESRKNVFEPVFVFMQIRDKTGIRKSSFLF